MHIYKPLRVLVLLWAGLVVSEASKLFRIHQAVREKYDNHPLTHFLTAVRNTGPVSACPESDHTLPRVPPDPHVKYLFAANLVNSAKVMPQIITQLVPALLMFKRANVHVSIYESSSYDATGQWLSLLERVLNSLSIPNTIVTNGLGKTTEDRIEFLAKLRNLALAPILPPPSNSSARPAFQADHVLFFNDVAFCAQDILRLVQHSATTDMACGVDLWNWAGTAGAVPADFSHLASLIRTPMPRLPRGLNHYYLNLWQSTFPPSARAPDTKPLQFYDNWVAHDLDGRGFRVEYPYANSSINRPRALQGLPFPVQCCWNGMALLRAAPLLAGLRFRGHTRGECYESECTLLCDDYWRLGYSRIMVDPSVRVTYCPSMYPYLYSTDRPTASWQQTAAAPIDWGAVVPPPLTECCEGDSWDDCRVHFPWLEVNYTQRAMDSNYAPSRECYKMTTGDKCSPQEGARALRGD